jgi:hypothetical protein
MHLGLTLRKVYEYVVDQNTLRRKLGTELTFEYFVQPKIEALARV